MIGYITQFDGIALDSTYGQNQVSISRVVSPSMTRILGDGMYDLDGMQSPLIQTEYSASFIDRAGNTNARALFQRLGRAGWLKAKNRAGADVMSWAKLVSIDSRQSPIYWQNQDRNPYDLKFSCRPYWYEITDTTSILTATTVRTIANNGNARSSWLTFYITSAIASTLTISIGRDSGSTYGLPLYGEALYDGTGKQQIIYSASKPEDTMLMIDCRLNNVTLNGADDYKNITLPNTQAQLGYLYPGSNRITFSTAVTGTIVYRGAYI